MIPYLKLLHRIDAWYRSAKCAFPREVPCEVGCRECCLGLFEISVADRELLLEGFEALPKKSQKEIALRARSIMAKLRKVYPDLGEDFEGFAPEEIDEITDLLGAVECPLLGAKGECRLYRHRPLVCRLAGLPVVDPQQGVIHPEGCASCRLTPEQAPKLPYAELREEEHRLLRKRYGNQADVSLLIPQVFSTRKGGGRTPTCWISKDKKEKRGPDQRRDDSHR